MKKFRQVVLAAAAALVLAGLAPASAAAQSYCDTLTNGLRLPKPNFNTPSWQFGGCIRNSFDIINSSVPLIGSTATFSQIWTSTISGRNGSGLYLSSYTLVGSSVYVMGHAQFGSSLTLTNGAGIGGAVTFTASTLTVNGLYARYGVQATTGSFTSGLVASTLTVVGDSIHRDIANDKAVRVLLGSSRPKLAFTDNASASVANGSVDAGDLWLNPSLGNITSWGLHSFRSTIELVSGQAINNAATFTASMTVRGASTFTATGDFSVGLASGISLGGPIRFPDGTYQYTKASVDGVNIFPTTTTTHALYVLNATTLASSVTVKGIGGDNYALWVSSPNLSTVNFGVTTTRATMNLAGKAADENGFTLSMTPIATQHRSVAFLANMLAGMTGSTAVGGIQGQATNSAGATGPAVGVVGLASVNASGRDMRGVIGEASSQNGGDSSSYNYGVLGVGGSNAQATRQNIGTLGFAQYAASESNYGGYFALMSDNVGAGGIAGIGTTKRAAAGSAALAANNADQAAPIFLALDNGTTVYQIADGGNILPSMRASQTIAAGNTVAADNCGGTKRITAAGAVTTDTTNTFTAPALANEGCCMDVVNVGSNAITLDNNANFYSAGAADVVLGANDTARVCSTGASGFWYQIGATGNN